MSFQDAMVQLAVHRAQHDRIVELIEHTPECAELIAQPYREDDDHDKHLTDLRSIFINMPDKENHPEDFLGPHSVLMEELVISLHMSDHYQQWFSEMALSMSLCPMHMVDYAICFDDDDPECAAIRSCFPDHDT